MALFPVCRQQPSYCGLMWHRESKLWSLPLLIRALILSWGGFHLKKKKEEGKKPPRQPTPGSFKVRRLPFLFSSSPSPTPQSCSGQKGNLSDYLVLSPAAFIYSNESNTNPSTSMVKNINYRADIRLLLFVLVLAGQSHELDQSYESFSAELPES